MKTMRSSNSRSFWHLLSSVTIQPMTVAAFPRITTHVNPAGGGDKYLSAKYNTEAGSSDRADIFQSYSN